MRIIRALWKLCRAASKVGPADQLHELHAAACESRPDRRGMDAGIFPFVRDRRPMGLFAIDANLRDARQRFEDHGGLWPDFVRARMRALVPDKDHGAHASLHPMHAAGLQDPVYVVELEA